MEKTDKVKIRIPLLPNYVTGENGLQYDLKKDFTREELEELLKEWSEAILARLTT